MSSKAKNNRDLAADPLADVLDDPLAHALDGEAAPAPELKPGEMWADDPNASMLQAILGNQKLRPRPRPPRPTMPKPTSVREAIANLPSAMWEGTKYEFANPDPEAKAMLKTMAYPGTLISDAVLEAAKRVQTGFKEGLGADEWKAAIKGEGSSAPEILQKKFNRGGIESYLEGLPLQAITDPMNALFGPIAATEAAIPKLSVWNALKQNVRQNVPLAGPMEKVLYKASQPIASTLRESGRKIFSSPLRPVQAEVFADYPGIRKHGPTAVADYLYNNGEPLFSSTSSPDMIEQITRLRQAAGKQIGKTTKEVAGTANLKDPAPGLARRATGELAQELADAGGDITTIRKNDWVDWLAKKIGSEDENERAAGIAILKEHADPKLHKLIDFNAPLLENSLTEDDARKFFKGFVKDIGKGPQDLNQLQNLKTSYAGAASGNKVMGSDAYAITSKHDQVKEAEKAVAGALGDIIDNAVENEMPGIRPREKRAFSLLSKSEVPLIRAIKADMKKPTASKLDLFNAAVGLSVAAGTGSVLPLALPFVVKGMADLLKSPEVGMTWGARLGKASNMGIWDNMARRYMLDSARPRQKLVNEKDPLEGEL